MGTTIERNRRKADWRVWTLYQRGQYESVESNATGDTINKTRLLNGRVMGVVKLEENII